MEQAHSLPCLFSSWKRDFLRCREGDNHRTLNTLLHASQPSWGMAIEEEVISSQISYHSKISTVFQFQINDGFLSLKNNQFRCRIHNNNWCFCSGNMCNLIFRNAVIYCSWYGSMCGVKTATPMLIDLEFHAINLPLSKRLRPCKLVILLLAVKWET